MGFQFGGGCNSTATSSLSGVGAAQGFTLKPSEPGAVTASSFCFKPPVASAAATTSTASISSVFGSGSLSGFTFKPPDASAVTSSTVGSSSIFGAVPSGFNFKPPEPSSSTDAASNAAEADDEEEYKPPKPDSVKHSEEDAFYNVRCKLFYKKDEGWQDRGVGNLFLKPCDKKTQLLIRAETTLGNIMLNVLVTDKMPVGRQGTNNVSIVCVPNPPLDAAKKSKTPICMLIRVKTSDMADELLKHLTECKEKAASD